MASEPPTSPVPQPPAVAQPVPAPSLAHCAEHPADPSAATCFRCGRFACRACLALDPPPLCRACHARVSDPLGILGVGFSVGGSLRNGWRLFRTVFWPLVAIAAIFGLPAGLIEYEIDRRGGDFGASFRIMRVYDFTVWIFGIGAALALLVSAAEGGPRGLGYALGEGAKAWPRIFGARLRAGILTFLWALLLIIPGLVKAVNFSLSTEVAYRDPDREPLEHSTALVTGRRFEVLGLFAVAWFVLVVAIAGMAFLAGFAEALLPPLAPFTAMLIDAAARLAECFAFAVGLAAFYGFRRDRAK
jgi:hypothetical protein